MDKSSPEVIAALELLRFAAARRELDNLPSSELPQLGVSALEAGLDSPNLRELAGEIQPTWADTGPIFDRVLRDFGITPPSKPQSAHALARYYAEHVLSGTISPYEGARRIWMEVANVSWGDRQVWDIYSIFVGLASEWEDYPSGRPEFEQRIREEAKNLLIRTTPDEAIPCEQSKRKQLPKRKWFWLFFVIVAVLLLLQLISPTAIWDGRASPEIRIHVRDASGKHPVKGAVVSLALRSDRDIFGTLSSEEFIEVLRSRKRMSITNEQGEAILRGEFGAGGGGLVPMAHWLFPCGWDIDDIAS